MRAALTGKPHGTRALAADRALVPEQGLASCTVCLHVAEHHPKPNNPGDGQATSALLCPARPVTIPPPAPTQLRKGVKVTSKELSASTPLAVSSAAGHAQGLEH